MAQWYACRRYCNYFLLACMYVISCAQLPNKTNIYIFALSGQQTLMSAFLCWVGVVLPCNCQWLTPDVPAELILI